MEGQSSPLVVVLGGINMDLVTYAPNFPQAGETVVGSSFLTYPGGKGANQAVAVARMEARAAMVGRVGTDIFGPQLVDLLRDSGVDAHGVRYASGVSSGIAVINVDQTAQNRIIQVLGANAECGEAEAARVIELLPQAGALMLQLEVSLELSLSVAREASSLEKIVILDPGPIRPLPPEFYPYCSVITPNETEAQALVGFPVVDRASAVQAAGVLLDRGAQAAVIKLGSMGAYYAVPEGGEYVEPFRVEAVDSVAAGDAFNGALTVSLAEGKPLSEAVRVASAAGALAVTKVGAQDSMPTREEVERLRNTRPS